MNVVLIDGVWYEISTPTGSNPTLIVIPAPADGDDSVTRYDAEELLSQLDGLSHPEDESPLAARVAEITDTYSGLRDEARTTGARQALDDARAAQVPWLIATHVLAARDAQRAELGGDAPGGDTPPGDTPPGDTPTGETPPNALDELPDDITVEVDIGADGQPIGHLVTASGRRSVPAIASPAIATRGGSLADQVAGGLATSASDLARFAPTEDVREATLVQASAFQTMDAAGTAVEHSAGTPVTDAMLAEQIQQVRSGFASGSSPAGSAQRLAHNIATIQLVDTGTPLVTNPFDLAERRSVVRSGRSLSQDERSAARIQAAADPNCTIYDRRFAVPDCRDLTDPMANLFEEYSAPHCNLEYYREFPAINEGITVWDETRKAAYCAARDAWYASVSDGAPDAALYAAMLGLQKQCYVPGCLPTDKVSMVSVAACMEWPEEWAACNAEMMAPARRALESAFIRRRNEIRLQQIDAYLDFVDVDVADPLNGFSNGSFQLGAIPVLEEVVQTLVCNSIFRNRTTTGNYVVLIPAGLAKILGWDNRRAAFEGREALQSALSNAFGGNSDASFQIISMLDIAPDETDPFPNVPSAPGLGNMRPYGDYRFGCDFRIRVIDPDDFFVLRRAGRQLGTQMTPDYAKGNWEFGLFEETTEGTGKDGCHGAFAVELRNVEWNGARIGTIDPISTCV